MKYQEGETSLGLRADNICHIQIMVHKRKKNCTGSVSQPHYCRGYVCFVLHSGGVPDSMVEGGGRGGTGKVRDFRDKRGGCLVPSFRKS